MPVAMLVIVPTSRGVSCGVKASRTWLIPANVRSKTLCKLSGAVIIGASFRAWVLQAWLTGSACRLRHASGAASGFRFVLLFQKFADALFQRREVIRDAPSHFLSIRGEFDPADQVRRGLEPDADFSREGLVERILYRRALLRRQVERAAHERGLRRCLEGLGEALFRLAVHLAQAAREHLAHAFFQTRRGEIRQRLSRDGKHFLLGPATDGLIQVMGVASQRFLSLGAQGVGRLPRFVEEPLTFGFRLVRRLAQEGGALLVELLVLVLELVALLLRFGLFRVGVREFRGDPLLPRVDGVEDRLVEKALQQPHQDDEVERLRTDGEPIDEHGLLSCGLGDDVVPERIGENENHRDHEAVDRDGLDHRQADKQGAGDRRGGIGLLRQRTQRRGDRPPFAERRSDTAQGDREAGGDD